MRRFRLRHLPFAVAALCAAMSPPLRAQVASGALPTGWNVTGGSAAISRNGSTLNIVQGTQQAIVNFQSFNVGSGAVVDIRQPGTQSALLARTVGGGVSQIDGQIKANGALWLINPAGIMVGSGARIDVGRFVASTLNVSDSDFLAGRLTFGSGGTAGEVRNDGTINAASGGSIYLVAPSVTNTGTLHAPGGEVLLAAGQNVQLMDTGTPGVSVEITGTRGEAKNLGRIVAEAGRIGLAAGLVSNSGAIHADSVVSEGGRVFLRASGDLQTTAASDISASGTKGGRVELIADGAAKIDGRVAATGSAGAGGYVDTSGRSALDVVNVPLVGRGGEWHIDPYDIEIVASGTNAATGTSAIVSTGAGAQVGADTITAQLDAGVNVSITTGTGNPATDLTHGDITVSAAIAKTGSVDSALTLNANNNIVINAPITSANSALALNLNSNRQDDYIGVDHTVQLNANLGLHGGVLTVSEGSTGNGNGAITINAGTTSLDFATSAINAATVNVWTGGTLALGRAGSALSGALNNDGLVTVAGTGTAVLDHGGTHGGSFDVAAGSTLSMSGGHNFAGGAAFTGTGTVEWAGAMGLAVPVVFGAAGPALVLHDVNLSNRDGGLLTTQGAVAIDGQVTVSDLMAWNNAGTVSVGPGSTAAVLLQGTGSFDNQAGGTVRIDQGLLDATFDAAHANNGAIVLANGGTLRSAAADIYNNGNISGSGVLALGGGSGALALGSATGGTLFNNGRVAPGTSAAVGTLSVQGNYNQGSAGTLAIKLAGLGAGHFDLLDIDGSAQLAGTVQLQAMPGFAAANAAFADFVVARGGGNGGAFGQVSTAPIATGSGVTTLSVGYAASATAAARVTASVVPAAPAPSADICTIAPNSALCQVLTPPINTPVQLATNTVIRNVNLIAPSTYVVPPGLHQDPSTTPPDNKGSDATQPAGGKSGAKDKDQAVGATDKGTKKMYCN
ncbi:filamentous hemagglutinin N-terminal domain-containing protein [Ramlibacter ginsenosidimutans]|uniref:Filamentous hemagglutinin N-terminal domain-containing protein n=1 Tax=Ramlibacter ginsenosidimutans TaxID=502333 RepID=A0A934WLZ9_9BURK|nr:filamentous hemagglutinin N-terminal domain-containing protein [Ramlibacter ginsenosidimutans]MBK6005642.1 filamentous hemagglutinin N-terminal domain-containing protein [Ramlibacter ginsenosidimutans]